MANDKQTPKAKAFTEEEVGKVDANISIILSLNRHLTPSCLFAAQHRGGLLVDHRWRGLRRL